MTDTIGNEYVVIDDDPEDAWDRSILAIRQHEPTES